MDQQALSAALLARVALGDRAAFAELYERSSAKLFGVCLRLLKDKSEAEEALQEIYIKIWHNAGHYAETGGGPMGWLVTVARNHAIDLLRARHMPAEDIAARNDLADSAPNPEALAAAGDLGLRIDRCLDKLDRDKADAVRSAYLDGYSYKELATRFGVPLNTMRTWLRRSLLALRDCLRGEEGIEA